MSKIAKEIVKAIFASPDELSPEAVIDKVLEGKIIKKSEITGYQEKIKRLNDKFDEDTKHLLNNYEKIYEQQVKINTLKAELDRRIDLDLKRSTSLLTRYTSIFPTLFSTPVDFVKITGQK